MYIKERKKGENWEQESTEHDIETKWQQDAQNKKFIWQMSKCESEGAAKCYTVIFTYKYATPNASTATLLKIDENRMTVGHWQKKHQQQRPLVIDNEGKWREEPLALTSTPTTEKPA